MRVRIFVVVALLSVGLAVGLMSLPTHGLTDADRTSARERLKTPRVSKRFEAAQPAMPEDLDTFLESGGKPTADWPEHKLRALHKHIFDAGGFGDDRKSFFPLYLCDTRCSSSADVPAMWSGSREECMESCVVDRLIRENEDSAAVAALLVAERNGNAALYEDVVVAYPGVWAHRRDRIAEGRARGMLALWWGDAMRSRAPGLQKRLYGFGSDQGGAIGGMSLMASGWSACTMVGDQPVCP